MAKASVVKFCMRVDSSSAYIRMTNHP